MEIEYVLLILIVAVIPAALTLYGMNLIVKKFFDREHGIAVKDLKEMSKKTTLPLRLQAAERMILYLERINPVHSILTLYKPGMSAQLLQSELVKQIRTEFEHNLAQQIYISEEAWSAIKSSKEETIKIINIAAQQTGQDGTGLDLSNKIYELMAQIKEAPTDTAGRILKREARRLF